MDEIALLCNLHADGPATLKVLRRAGLRTLSHVSAIDVRKLADTLGVSPSFARRFAREARLLGGRMGVEGLDTEETTSVAIVAPAPEIEAPARAPAMSRELELARESDARRMAAREVRRSIATETPEEEIAPPHVIASPSVITSPERPAIVPPGGTRLVSYVIAGLDRQACDRLVAQGIRTLEELAAAPGLSLARRLEMPLPRLLDLQYLAQQRLNAPRKDSDAQTEAAEREYVVRPSPRATPSRVASAPEHDAPAWRPDIGHLQPPLHVPMQAESEVAGPFA